MKILLDEVIPIQFKKELQDYDIYTVRDLNWLSIKNGELLKRALREGFDIFLTCDKNIKYQQNLAEINLKIIVLISFSNDIQHLLPMIPKIKNVLNDLEDKKLKETYIEINQLKEESFLITSSAVPLKYLPFL